MAKGFVEMTNTYRILVRKFERKTIWETEKIDHKIIPTYILKE
jgi:hypothetical protein